jgi:fibronectin-binding autotransporter adhesin
VNQVGGIANYGPVTFDACTISGNFSADGVGGMYVIHQQPKSIVLTDTIIAGNTGGGGSPSDFGGPQASDVTGSYDVVGTGGPGAWPSGADGIIVVTDFAALGLAPLADNGGLTQTMALLPGSPANGAGTALGSVSTDQRGLPLNSPFPDIGAFQFQPANVIALAFSGVANQTITYGTTTITCSGTLAGGTQAPPAGETIAITFNGQTRAVPLVTGGYFSTSFPTAGLTVSNSPYAISYFFVSDGTFGGAGTTSTLTVTRAAPSVTVHDSSGIYNNIAFAAHAEVIGLSGHASSSLEGVTPSFTYYKGTYASINELSGVTPLLGAPILAGSYTVVAGFAGSAN